MNLNSLKIDQSCPLCTADHAFVHWSSFRDAFVSLTTRSFHCPLCLTAVQGVDKFALHLVSHDLRNKMQIQEMLQSSSTPTPHPQHHQCGISPPIGCAPPVKTLLATPMPLTVLNDHAGVSNANQHQLPTVMAPPPMYTAVASQPPPPQPVNAAIPSSNPPIIPELSIKDSPLAGASDGDGQNMTIAHAPPKDALDELLQDFTEFVQTELVKQEDKNNTAMGDGMTCPYPSPLQESSTLNNTRESALNENLPSPWSDGGAILESTDFPPVPPTIGSSGKNIIKEKQTKGITDSRNSKRSGGKSDKSESSVRCDMCGWNFDNEKFLQLHKVLMHSPHRSSRLLGPGSNLKESDQLKGGRAVGGLGHKKEFKCRECPSLVFTSGEEFTEHLKGVHEDHRHVCDICGKLFKLRGSLLVHQRVVHNPVPGSEGQDRSFSCQICHRKFSNKYRRDHHEKRHGVGEGGLEESEIKCSERESSSLVSKESLNNFEHTEDIAVIMHKCENVNCGAAFHSETELLIHSTACQNSQSQYFNDQHNVMEKLKAEREELPTSPTTAPYPQRVPTSMEASSQSQQNRENQQGSDTKQWECDICKKSFTTKYFLKKHKRLHTGETPYTCGKCGKSFTFQQSYHKHMLYHTDEKPYTCNQCGRSFKELSTLQNHERIHSGERPFACETCGKSFRQRVSYLVHRRIHTGVMPYVCEYCNKKFRYKVTQRTHKCPNRPVHASIETGSPIMPEGSQPLDQTQQSRSSGVEMDQRRKMILPTLPLRIKEDLDKLRLTQTTDSEEKQSLKSKAKQSSNKHSGGGQLMDNSTAVSQMTTPEEPQLAFHPTSSAAEVAENSNSPLGQLRQLSINEIVTTNVGGLDDHDITQQQPSYPSFFNSNDFDLDFDRT